MASDRYGLRLMRDTGIGMTSQRTRMRMVERLRAQGIRDETVLAAMGEVPRHLFVDEALASRAYEDIALPLGYGQTISSPHTVARMTELARNGRMLGKVLEVGTGCGYQTAVLGRVAKQVYSMERLAALIRKARRNLREAGVRNVHLRHGDGQAGMSEVAPFDADRSLGTAGTTAQLTTVERRCRWSPRPPSRARTHPASWSTTGAGTTCAGSSKPWRAARA